MLLIVDDDEEDIIQILEPLDDVELVDLLKYVILLIEIIDLLVPHDEMYVVL